MKFHHHLESVADLVAVFLLCLHQQFLLRWLQSQLGIPPIQDLMVDQLLWLAVGAESAAQL